MNIFIIAVFIFTYTVIAVQKLPFIKLDRPSGVLIGSTLLILAGAVTLDGAYRMIDWDVITFLLGMMIITAYLELSNFFPLAAAVIAKKAKSGRMLLALTIVTSAVLSALFVNDTVCLLFTPVILTAASHLRINPIPHLLGIAMASNIGSALTITGNPQNMFIGIASGIGFLKFMLLSAVPVALGLLVAYAVIYFLYKKDLGEFKDKELSINYKYDRKLGFKAFLALGVTLVLFFSNLGYPLSALIGATILMTVSGRSPKDAFAKVDWQLLLFFAGLFVVMGAFAQAVDLNSVVAKLSLNPESPATVGIIGAVVLTLSNLVSNVPAVIMVFPLMQANNFPELFTVYLAQIATFAGNLTLVGSVANMIVAEKAEHMGVKLDFWTHLRAGVIITLLSCAISTAYIIFLLAI